MSPSTRSSWKWRKTLLLPRHNLCSYQRRLSKTVCKWRSGLQNFQNKKLVVLWQSMWPNHTVQLLDIQTKNPAMLPVEELLLQRKRWLPEWSCWTMSWIEKKLSFFIITNQNRYKRIIKKYVFCNHNVYLMYSTSSDLNNKLILNYIQ